MPLLDNIAGYAQAGIGLSALFSSGGDDLHGWQVRGLKGATNRSGQIAKMLQNRQDPAFLDLMAEEEEADIRSGAQGRIRELLLTDRRSRTRGITALQPMSTCLEAK